MKISNIIYNCKESLKNAKDFLVGISKEMVTVLWVMIVLLLIIWSYVENGENVNTQSELSMYQINISDTLKID